MTVVWLSAVVSLILALRNLGAIEARIVPKNKVEVPSGEEMLRRASIEDAVPTYSEFRDLDASLLLSKPGKLFTPPTVTCFLPNKENKQFYEGFLKTLKKRLQASVPMFKITLFIHPERSFIHRK